MKRLRRRRARALSHPRNDAGYLARAGASGAGCDVKRGKIEKVPKHKGFPCAVAGYRLLTAMKFEQFALIGNRATG